MPKYETVEPGEKFGRLTVIRLSHKKKHVYISGKTEEKEYYLCKCDCGKEKIVEKNSLRNKKRGTKSCGCFQKEMVSQSNTKHGMYKSRIYKTWSDMIQRCYNKKEPSYKYCGSRGITVCPEWKKSFICFYKWAISNGYSDDLTLDRKDNGGNYNPVNCRWITMLEQERNKRNNRIIKKDGKELCVSEWAEILKIKSNTIYTRLHRGWDVGKALGGK